MVSSFKQPSHVGVLKRHTEHYDLEVPYFDTPGWGQYIEGDLDTIDALLFGALGMENVKGIWLNATHYAIGDRVIDKDTGQFFQALVDHTSADTGEFSEDRAAHPTYWQLIQTDWNFRGAWAPATVYVVGDVVYDEIEHVVAVCTVAHTSTSDIRTDAANWDFIVDLADTVEEAETAADQAADSASDAAASASSAASSASAASGSASDAAISASSASSSASSALASEMNAAASAADAHADALSADADASAASADADAAELALDEFTDLYLGAKSSDPTTDNDGDPLQDGALYWNTPAKLFRVWDADTGTWRSGGGSTDAFVVKTGDTMLGDLLLVPTEPSDVPETATSKGYVDGLDAAQKTYIDAADAAIVASVGTLPTTAYVDAADALRVLKSGDIMTGDLTINKASPVLMLNKANGNAAGFMVSTANKNRWFFAMANSVSETGGNEGSDFGLGRYDDAGNYLGSPLVISRKNGSMTMEGDVTVNKSNPFFGFNKQGAGEAVVIAGWSAWVNRWQMLLGNYDAESGANAGSNFEIVSYDDAGAEIGKALTIERKTNKATFGGQIVGSQLKFPATANPSTDANTLDDYEEGTFVPSLQFGGASTGMTYSGNRLGTYVKIGKVVYCHVRIALTAKGSATGAAQIIGFPFPTTLNFHLGMGHYANLASISNLPFGFLQSDVMSLNQGGATAKVALTHANFTDTSDIILSGYYFATN